VNPLVDRLAAHRTLASVPREQLEWLASKGVERTLEPGEILTPSTGPVKGLYVVLDGHFSIRVDRGAGPRIVMEWHGGDVTGVLPYSRIKGPPGNVVAEEQSHILAIDPAEMPEMIRECHELTAVLVHVMLDRARVFKSSELLDEKMLSLGRLAAGLAHELNNPASAVARSAKTLVAELDVLEDATKKFCGLTLNDAQCVAITHLRDRPAAARPALTSLQLADRQDAIENWLDAHDVSGLDVAPLAESGFEVSDFESLCAQVGSDRLSTVLAYVVADRTVQQLAAEIATSATRIHSLVQAVKGFTYLNQQATLQPIAIGQGIVDTVTVLRSKAKEKAVEVKTHIPADLPAVEGYGGELNQVWANLVDNAIDAAPGGHVTIEAEAADSKVVVRVIDDGHGIPPDVASRIFDPFFTTKNVGQGTGLGLDIARRIVQRHHGAIDVHSGPSGTQFSVTLPAVSSTPAVHTPQESRT
jgi:signal transduction histidine kinase